MVAVRVVHVVLAGLIAAGCSGEQTVATPEAVAESDPAPTLEALPAPTDTPAPPPPTLAPPAELRAGDLTLALVAVERLTGDAAALQRYDPTDVSRLYATYAADGVRPEALHVYSYVDPLAGSTAPDEFSRFDTAIEIAGRPAIHGPWFDEASREVALGTELVWFATPLRYVWLRSRAHTVDGLVAIAQQLTITAVDASWLDPPDAVSEVGTGLGVTNPGDHLLDRAGTRATYSIEPSAAGTIEVLLVESSAEGEVAWLRSMAFGETTTEVRGKPAHVLLMQPTTDSHPGQTHVVWQEDAETVGIAWTNSDQHADALVAAANHFDPRPA